MKKETDIYFNIFCVLVIVAIVAFHALILEIFLSIALAAFLWIMVPFFIFSVGINAFQNRHGIGRWLLERFAETMQVLE